MSCIDPFCNMTANGICQRCGIGMWPIHHTLPSAPQGCICPPTSEKTCESISCPRKNHLKGLGYGTSVSGSTESSNG